MDLAPKRTAATSTVFECLASRSCRLVLGVLDEDGDSCSTSELATELAARCDRADAPAVPGGEREQMLVLLEHKHLPKLADAGLIEYEQDRETVSARDHHVLEDPAVRRAIDPDRDAESELDELFEALGAARRCHVLGILHGLRHPIRPRPLAVRIAARERDTVPEAVPDGQVEQILTTLRHVHLPTLVQAGLVERNETDGTVEFQGHPAFHERWVDPEFLDRSLVDRDGQTSMASSVGTQATGR